MRSPFALLVVVGTLAAIWLYRSEIAEQAPQLAAQLPRLPFASAPEAPATPQRLTIPPDATPHFAPPGVFYVRRPFAVANPSGAKIFQPGEEVRLMYRHKDGRMLVTNGKFESTVQPTFLTNDRIEALRAAP